MTAARQERKSPRSLGFLSVLAATASILGGLGLDSSAIGAATSEQVVANRHTGLAIDGFDPVAYFVDSSPAAGRPELELRLGGGMWRFRNEGNRAAFAANPEIYAPRFGGYDPIAVSRGAASAGNPTLWVIAGQRLYLFYSDASKAAFTSDPDTAIAAAERSWPVIRRSLVP